MERVGMGKGAIQASRVGGGVRERNLMGNRVNIVGENGPLGISRRESAVFRATSIPAGA